MLMTADNTPSTQTQAHAVHEEDNAPTATPLMRSESSMSTNADSKFSLDETKSQTSSIDTNATERELAEHTNKTKKPKGRRRGQTITLNSRPNDDDTHDASDAEEDEEEEDGEDGTAQEEEPDEEDFEEAPEAPAGEASPALEKKDPTAEFHDQIQGLQQVHDSDSEDEDVAPSPKSHRSTVSSLHSFVSSASNYDFLLARLGSGPTDDAPAAVADTVADPEDADDVVDWGVCLL